MQNSATFLEPKPFLEIVFFPIWVNKLLWPQILILWLGNWNVALYKSLSTNTILLYFSKVRIRQWTVHHHKDFLLPLSQSGLCWIETRESSRIRTYDTLRHFVNFFSFCPSTIISCATFLSIFVFYGAYRPGKERPVPIWGDCLYNTILAFLAGKKTGKRPHIWTKELKQR